MIFALERVLIKSCRIRHRVQWFCVLGQSTVLGGEVSRPFFGILPVDLAQGRGNRRYGGFLVFNGRGICDQFKQLWRS